MDRVFGATSHNFSLCNLEGRDKTLKLLYDVWKEVIFKTAKDCTNDFGSSCDCLGDRCR